MPSLAASTATRRSAPEWVVPTPSSEGWRRGAIFLHLALWGPYLTSAVPALHQDGQFPVRPVLFMVGLGLANLAWMWPKRPDYPRLAFVLLGLLALRAADVALLQRQPEGVDAEQAGDALSHLANLFSAAVIFSSLGVFYRTGIAPVRQLAALSILVLAGAVLAEFLGLCAYTTVPGRPSGFPGDANAGARMSALFGGEVDEMQSGERWKDLQDGLEGASVHPLTGLGTGTGQTIYQPHNQLVTVWIGLGLFAVLIYGGLVAALLFKSLMSGFQAIYCVLTLAGCIPLAQTLLDNHAYIYATAVAMVFTARRFCSFRVFRPRTV